MHIFEHKVLRVVITIYHISMCYLQILPEHCFFFLHLFSSRYWKSINITSGVSSITTRNILAQLWVSWATSMRGLSDKLFLSPVLSTKALMDSHYFVQDWNQDNSFPVIAGSFHLNFSSRGTSDSFASMPNSTELWGIATKMVETCLPFVDMEQASKGC